ncbi:hypothetical protein JM93_00828 [Roseibium hamelinense]|uniref:DUF1491 family protein n=1 Tax=Roseibium hamelinense TaxID=150831 RepID=A0A562TIN5_9HYPH|nr:DUF1491 family protein [Roseibium hamelinense]MTI42649.1 DUF1491 family protein [Roseibium hamelinense]TWI93273.1 hypothetical protein JM93_00828 [Roseibium hamelinense]
MRAASDFFVAAFVRRLFQAGGFAAVSKRGAAEAGAIFILVDRLDGTLDLYGPAPQAYFVETPDGRLFERVLSQADREAVDARLASEARMDPDYWLVEAEARDGQVDLPLADDGDEAPKKPDPWPFR